MGIDKGRRYRYLVDEQRIARQLECLATVRLQAERRPHSVDRGVGKASFRSHRADRPVRRVGRRRTQCPLDYLSNLIVVDGARAARAGFVKRAITAILQKSATPLANGVFMNAEFGSHGLTWQAVCTSQDRAAPLR